MARILRRVGVDSPSSTIFRRVFGPVNFYQGEKDLDYCERTTTATSGLPDGTICWAGMKGYISSHLTAHELGHVFNAVMKNRLIANPYDELYNEGVTAYVYDSQTNSSNPQRIAGRINECTGRDPDTGKCINYYLRTGHGYRIGTEHNTKPDEGEDFADMFANWAYNSFDYSTSEVGNQPAEIVFGLARYNWMEYHMMKWLAGSYNLTTVPPEPLDNDCAWIN